MHVVSGALTGDVYEYLGTTTLTNADLTTQSYGDSSLWRLVGVSQERRAGEGLHQRLGRHRDRRARACDAMATQSIDAIVVAAAVALAGGGVGGGLAGAGVWSQNRVATDVKAYILGNSTTDISAASISITATDSSGIRSIAGAAAIAASIGGAAGAISIGLSIAFNEVSDDVAAFIKDVGSKVEATSGNIVIYASSSGTTLFDLTAVNATQLDNAARAENDDPSTRGPGTTRRRNDLAADSAILTTLDDAFRTAGYELLPGVRYLSSDGSKTLKKGDTVKRVSGSGVGGTVGAVYRWVGTDNLSVNLGTTTYGTASLWERVLPVVSAISNGNGWEVVAGTDVYVITKDAGGNAAGLAADDPLRLGGRFDRRRLQHRHERRDQRRRRGRAERGADEDERVHRGQQGDERRERRPRRRGDELDRLRCGRRVGRDRDRRRHRRHRRVDRGLGRAQLHRRAAGRRAVATPAEVQAYIKGSSVVATGAITLDAVGNETIGSLVVALSASVAGGLSFGLALSGAGAYSENRVATFIKAYIEGDGGLGVGGASIALHATDSSNIAAFAGAASLAFTLGAVGVSFSIAATIAQNTIENQVEAYIKNASTRVSTTTGAIGAHRPRDRRHRRDRRRGLGRREPRRRQPQHQRCRRRLDERDPHQGERVHPGQLGAQRRRRQPLGDRHLAHPRAGLSPPPSRPRSARSRSAPRSASRSPRT